MAQLIMVLYLGCSTQRMIAVRLTPGIWHPSLSGHRCPQASGPQCYSAWTRPRTRRSTDGSEQDMAIEPHLKMSVGRSSRACLDEH